MNNTWSHAAARVLVRPLLGTFVRPNHLTTLRLVTGLAACLLLLEPTPGNSLWSGVLWLVSAFLDRADGELARIGNMQSRGGHLYDYYTDVALNSLFFVAAGFGLRHGWLGAWMPAAGVVAGLAMLACCWLSEVYEDLKGREERIWGDNFWGFQPDDGLYLLAPLTWLNWLAPVVLAAAVCTSAITVVIVVRLIGLRRRLAREAGGAAA